MSERQALSAMVHLLHGESCDVVRIGSARADFQLSIASQLKRVA